MTQPVPNSAFARDASVFPLNLDANLDRVLLTRITEAEFREASFLDQRMLANQRWHQWTPWADLERASLGLPADADFIFHIGHVGSTLISRLLGELDGVFALREPQLLRDFADLAAIRDRAEAPWPPEAYQPRLELALGWLSRRFAPGRRAMIKATSFVGEIAGPLLAPGGRALFLYVSPERYVETILAGDNSRIELAVMSRPRLARLHKRIGEERWKLWELGEGERAAMGWACEMTALEQAAAEAGADRVMWLDFDVFLADPARWLAEAAAFLGHGIAPERAQALAASPIMQRYSKAPEYGYSPQQREQTLAEARRTRAADIAAALRWLDKAGQEAERIAKALDRATGRTDVQANP